MRPLSRLALVALTLTWAAAWPAVSGAQLLGSDFAGNLYDVDPATGAATNRRSTGINNLVGLAYSADGVLYALSSFDNPAGDNSLFRVDPVTGARSLVGTTGVRVFEGDLAYQPTAGALFGLTGRVAETPNHLLRIDPATGAAASVGMIRGGGVNAEDLEPSAMAFAPDGTLYVLNTGQPFSGPDVETLLTVNPATAEVLSAVNVSGSLGYVAGMTFDPSSGRLYVVDGYGVTDVDPGAARRLQTLDPATGVLTSVGPLGLPLGMSALVAVPEPGAAVAACLAAVLVLRRRRPGY